MPSLLAIIYAAFISLGLPDNVLGSAWPQMAPDLGVDIAAAGILSITTSYGTIISSFCSAWILRRFSTSSVCAISTMLTSLGLAGFSLCPTFAFMPLCALILGLGAGAIDSALNAYVSAHYSAAHMNFLHAFWGVGALCGPFIVAFCLYTMHSWRPAYAAIACIQFFLAILLVYTRRLWRTRDTSPCYTDTSSNKTFSVKNDYSSNADDEANNEDHIPWYSIPLLWQSVFAFFLYCGAEHSAILWASTFLRQARNLDATMAAAAGGAFVIGMTLGRFTSGFVSRTLSSIQLIRIGTGTLMAGMLCATLAPWAWGTAAGFAIAGIGCAPIYPGIMKELNRRFGSGNVKRVIGIHMGFAYIGSLLFPAITGALISSFSPYALPAIFLCSSLGMLICHEFIERSICGEAIGAAHSMKCS